MSDRQAPDAHDTTSGATSVLLVDVERQIRQLVRRQLERLGMRVTVAPTVAEARTAVLEQVFGVVILDLTLPDGSGLEVLDLLREMSSTAHVVVMSDSAAEVDRVGALKRGADDYVVKPFYTRALAERVLAVPRRPHPAQDSALRIGRFDIDLRARRVTSGGQEVELTAKEFDLLAYLSVRPGYVFSREQLLNAVWGSSVEWQQAATVTEHVRRLRNKLEVDPSDPQILHTVRGAGYRLDVPEAERESRKPDHLAAPELARIIHVNGRIVFADAAACNLVGVSESDGLVGRHMLDLVAPASLAAARERLAAVLANQPRRSELIELQRVDGEPMTVEVSSSGLDWQGESAQQVRLTPLLDGSARLRRLVTGVLGDVTDAVVITDLHFHIRSWNAAAERLYGWAEAEVLGRHVLDVVPWLGDSGELAEVWERLELAGRWHGEGKQATRDGSVVAILGSTTLLRDDVGEPMGFVSVNRLVEVAGQASARELDAALAARVHQGLIDGEFEVHYQPIVDMADGHLITLEALVRWVHPDRGLLEPAEFLEAAERSGLIVEVGDFVLDRACRQAAEWRRSGADIRLGVNVSTRQLAAPDVVERFTETLHATGFDPAFLWIEITETALVQELETASHVLQSLAALGVGVAIDDFGTGWASLTYLRSFPVHALKVDQSFVAGAGHNANDTAIVRSILSLGAELDLFVVAEGIETQAQHDALVEMGCALGQGYLYGHPVPGPEVPLGRARRVPAREAGPGQVSGRERS